MTSHPRDLSIPSPGPQGLPTPTGQGVRPRFDDTIRDNVAVTYRKLERAHPKGNDRLAESYTRFHESLSGRCSSVNGYHSPEVFRRMVRAEDSMPVAELFRLAEFGLTDEVMEFLGPLLDKCERDVTKRPRRGPTLNEAAADLSTVAGRLAGVVIRASGDGSIDRAEERDIREHLDELETFTTSARAALSRDVER